MGFFSGIVDSLTGKTQSKAAKRAGELNSQANAEAAAGFNPQIKAGGAARNRLLSILGLDGGDGGGFDFQASPGFAFARDQGIQAIDRSASANSLLNSGANQKAQARFVTGLANQEFNNAEEKFTNRLLALTGQGDQATAQQSPFVFGQKASRADGLVGAANAKTAGVNNLLGISAFLGGKAIGSKI